MAGRLEGKTALITGGGSGHGRGIALTMAQEGARVVVADVGTSAFGHGSDAGRAHSVVDEILDRGGQALADTGDITDRDAARNMVDRTIDAFGKLDILVNVAGHLRLCTITDISADDWDSQMQVHLYGYFNTTHFAAQHWVSRRDYGRLINFTSDAGIWHGQPSLVSYCAAKAGVIGFTRACANALAAYGVTCNAIGPHGSTPMGDASMGGRMVPSSEAVGTERDPVHCAPLVVFLGSPDAAHVSGRVFGTYGGRYTLWSEPREEREVHVNFLAAPDRLYQELASSLTAGLSLRDLKHPMLPLDALGENWRETYGVRVPHLDMGAGPM